MTPDFNTCLHKMEFYKREYADTVQVVRIDGPLLTRVTKKAGRYSVSRSLTSEHDIDSWTPVLPIDFYEHYEKAVCTGIKFTVK